MATIRQRKLKNGLLVFDIQVKATDKNTGQQVTKTTTWRQQEGMSEKKAQKEVVLFAVRKNKTEVRTAVPFLGSIPFIGRLFSYESEEEEESELAIFITPEVKF